MRSHALLMGFSVVLLCGPAVPDAGTFAFCRLSSVPSARMVRPWAYLPKGGYSHEALLPGRAGRFRGRRPCGIGDSFYESLKRK